jgi:hypothetical protein
MDHEEVGKLWNQNADDEAIRARPELADTRIIAYFLHLRCRKNH